MGETELESEKQVLCSYLGVSFSIFLAYIPSYSVSLVPKLQSQVRQLRERVITAEEQLRQMKCRRKEDSKANARVVEIFATHRNAWQAEEKQLLQQIEDQRAKIHQLERDSLESNRTIQTLQHMIAAFISSSTPAPASSASASQQQQMEQQQQPEAAEEESSSPVAHDDQVNFTDVVNVGHDPHFPFTSDFLASSASSKFWADRATLWQDVQFESLDSLYHMKHFVARREAPWKVDGDSTGVSSKLKMLEQELLNLEKIGKSDLMGLPSLLRKQAKRYQALTTKIDDLCRRMQASDPSEPTISPEFRTQRQTESLLETFRLQQRASETGQKLMSIQTEIGKSYYRDDVGSAAKVAAKRSMDSIRNNLQEIQRSLEIWLARIIGDLEGILARDGSSCVREYCISRYPYVE